jgi:hypothetical protein
MATWKKLIFSGSDISQLNDDLGVHLSGSAGGAVDHVGSVTLGSTGSLAVRYDGTYITASGVDPLGDLTIVSASVDTSRIAQDTIVVSQISASALVTSSAQGGPGLSADTTGSDSKVVTAKAIVDYVESKADAANDLKLSGSDASSTTIDLTTDILFVTSGSDGSIHTNISEASNTGSIAISVNTGSEHFISGSRKTISVSDTQGSDGIDLTYDTGSGVLSATIQTSSFVLGDTTIALGDTASAISGLTGSNLLITESLISSSTFIGIGSGSFSGSFEGDGSGLTGLASTLLLTGSYDGTGTTGSVDLKTEPLTINGTVAEISASFNDTTNTLELRLPSDVIIQNDLQVNNDLLVQNNLTVVGTASFQHTTNLEVTDRFIRLASGSNEEGDGGIVVQQGADGLGDVFGFDGATSDRWGVGTNFAGSSSAFTPSGFMSLALTGSAVDDATIQSDLNLVAPDTRYNAEGNIFTSTTDQSIWIYS